MKLSILITLLNEELVLPQTHREISNQLEKMLGKELSDYEILYIDDGSSDKTFELIEEFARENDRIKYIRFSRNFGRESGILAGFKYARGIFCRKFLCTFVLLLVKPLHGCSPNRREIGIKTA